MARARWGSQGMEEATNRKQKAERGALEKGLMSEV
jgi:hypothetical protein